MRKLKILIIAILFISINKHPLDIFADIISDNTSSNSTPVISIADTQTTTNENNKSTMLDGEIGEWDPNLDDKPNFDKDDLEIDGNKPTQNDYYTISVTVPLNMEFYVLPNSDLAIGSFFSPTYKIKNNGSKDISVSINSFNQDNNTSNTDNDTAPLYVEETIDNDNKTQIKLEMCSVEDLDTWWQVNKKIDLTKLDSLNDEQKKLYNLSANESKGLKFDSRRWELPQNETNKPKAMSNFNAGFVFSVVQ